MRKGDIFNEEERDAARLIWRLKYQKESSFSGDFNLFLDAAVTEEPYGSEIVRLVHENYIEELFQALEDEAKAELWEIIKDKSDKTEEQYEKECLDDPCTGLVLMYIMECKARRLIDQGKLDYGEVLLTIEEERKICNYIKEGKINA